MKTIYKTMIGVAALAVPLLVLSGVYDSAHGFRGVLGGIGWFGFLLCVLVLIVLTVIALGRGVVRRVKPAAS